MSMKTIVPSRIDDRWDGYERDVMAEYTQSIEEGLDIARYEGLFVEVSKMPDGILKQRAADVLFHLVLNANLREDYPYTEPSDLEGIRSLRTAYPLAFAQPDRETLEKKIRGAWLGRICGCLLGKPIEGIRITELETLLKETGNYPMSRYILSTELTDELCEKLIYPLRGKCFADTVTAAPADDDTNYTVLASMLIEQKGRDFAPQDMLDLWLSSQKKDAYYTAEKAAWRNYFDGYCPPDTALYKNPYREWIGAQIRGDYFGYICPGDPEAAAALAFRDASISHTKNGIYGEMFIAAMLACAAVCDNISDVIKGGLAQIPSTSRLYAAVSDVLAWHQNGMPIEQCRTRISERYDSLTTHGWCHTISNAMIVVMALLYKDSYADCICAAVQTGFDTDCNGATVGSIYGMLHGADAIGEEWTSPIGGKLRTGIVNAPVYDIDELVSTTMKHIFS